MLHIFNISAYYSSTYVYCTLQIIRSEFNEPQSNCKQSNIFVIRVIIYNKNSNLNLSVTLISTYYFNKSAIVTYRMKILRHVMSRLLFIHTHVYSIKYKKYSDGFMFQKQSTHNLIWYNHANLSICNKFPFKCYNSASNFIASKIHTHNKWSGLVGLEVHLFIRIYNINWNASTSES